MVTELRGVKTPIIHEVNLTSKIKIMEKLFNVTKNKKGWNVLNKRTIKSLYNKNMLMIACKEHYTDDHLRDSENNNYETEYYNMEVNGMNDLLLMGELFIINNDDIIDGTVKEVGLLFAGNSTYKLKFR